MKQTNKHIVSKGTTTECSRDDEKTQTCSDSAQVTDNRRDLNRWTFEKPGTNRIYGTRPSWRRGKHRQNFMIITSKHTDCMLLIADCMLLIADKCQVEGHLLSRWKKVPMPATLLRK
jgi:hypothetical protein